MIGIINNLRLFSDERDPTREALCVGTRRMRSRSMPTHMPQAPKQLWRWLLLHCQRAEEHLPKCPCSAPNKKVQQWMHSFFLVADHLEFVWVWWNLVIFLIILALLYLRPFLQPHKQKLLLCFSVFAAQQRVTKADVFDGFRALVGPGFHPVGRPCRSSARPLVGGAKAGQGRCKGAGVRTSDVKKNRKLCLNIWIQKIYVSRYVH